MNVIVSTEFMTGIRISNDKVRIVDSNLIGMECVERETVGFPIETTDVAVRIEDVAGVPESGSNLCDLMAGHETNMYFKPGKDEMTLSIFDGRLKFPFDGVSYSWLG